MARERLDKLVVDRGLAPTRARAQALILAGKVTVAGQVGIAGHLSIGDKVSLAARTGVSISLPGGQVYSGNPAQPFRDEMKQRALVRRLPRLLERVKAIESALSLKSTD